MLTLNNACPSCGYQLRYADLIPSIDTISTATLEELYGDKGAENNNPDDILQ